MIGQVSTQISNRGWLVWVQPVPSPLEFECSDLSPLIKKLPSFQVLCLYPVNQQRSMVLVSVFCSEIAASEDETKCSSAMRSFMALSLPSNHRISLNKNPADGDKDNGDEYVS